MTNEVVEAGEHILWACYTLEIEGDLRPLAVTTDCLLVDPNERGPSDDLALALEATQNLNDHEQQLVERTHRSHPAQTLIKLR